MSSNGVLIGVDPHKASNTLAVLDPVSRVVVASKRFANTASGYEQLRSFAEQWPDHRWAVEGCHGAGRSLAQRLVGGGEVVFDVPAKLAARVRVYSQGHGRKTDLDDAVSVGTAALLGDGIARVHADDAVSSSRPADRVVRLHRRARPHPASRTELHLIAGSGLAYALRAWPRCDARRRNACSARVRRSRAQW
jgi:transposase